MKRSWAAQGARASVYAAGLGLALAGGHVAMRASAEAPVAVCAMEKTTQAKIAEVLSGGAIRLADGRKVLLSGIDVPRSAAGGAVSPYAPEAKAALVRLTKGGSITLSHLGSPSKSGWTRAQIFTGSGVWVQGALVAEGFARVRTFPDRRECASALLAREAKARLAKRGLWGLSVYSVRGVDTAGQAKGSFGLVEGVVAEAANVGGRLFLNFGDDYRTDFTVHVKPNDVALFAQSGLDLQSMEGKTIRVRGYIRERNGPVIDAAIPEQIELIR